MLQSDWIVGTLPMTAYLSSLWSRDAFVDHNYFVGRAVSFIHLFLPIYNFITNYKQSRTEQDEVNTEPAGTSPLHPLKPRTLHSEPFTLPVPLTATHTGYVFQRALIIAETSGTW